MSEAEPWEVTAPGPFLTIPCARGTVEVRALGEDRYLVTAPDHEERVHGFEYARERARMLAAELG
jgi:hypothetical protein